MTNPAASLRDIKLFGFLLAILGTSFSNSFCGIGLGIYVGALFLQFALKQGGPWKPFPEWKFLLPLLASLAVSLFISEYFQTSLSGYGKYLQGFALLYAGVDTLEGEREFKKLLLFLVAAYLLAVYAGFSQKFIGLDLLRGQSATFHSRGIWRMTGAFKHPNDFGTFLVPGFTLSLALMAGALRAKKSSLALLCVVLLTLLSYMMAQTLSRSAVLGVFASLFFFCLFFSWRWFAIAGILAALGLLWVVPSPLGHRMHELSNLHANSAGDRMVLLETTVRMIQAKPWFGLGLNTYSAHFQEFKPADFPDAMYSHNSYLQMAAESGLVGLFFYLLFLGAVIGKCAAALTKAKDSFPRLIGGALLAGALGILVNCLFESALQSTQLRTLTWALLGAVAAICCNGFLDSKHKISS